MQIVPLARAAKRGASDHRPGGIAFRDLLIGDEATLDNYALMLVDVSGGYTAPRHRHNFEQVRILLDGSFGFNDGQVQNRGSVGYFCEGTYYAQRGEGRSTTLLLQVAGASGSGYMSAAQLQAGIEALRQRGSFDKGVFTWLDAQGKKHNQDAYEAVWEHVFGKAVAYPLPRYEQPVLMRPDHFNWVAARAAPGVATRTLGQFNERGLRLAQVRLDAGATHTFQAHGRRRLMFCELGLGSVQIQAGAAKEPGDGAFSFGTSIELLGGEQVAIQAEALSQWFVFDLPSFDD